MNDLNIFVTKRTYYSSNLWTEYRGLSKVMDF